MTSANVRQGTRAPPNAVAELYDLSPEEKVLKLDCDTLLSQVQERKHNQQQCKGSSTTTKGSKPINPTTYAPANSIKI
eukprot:3323219-Amphidinium_carterae.1